MRPHDVPPGMRLRVIRQRRGLSIREAAKLAGFAYSHYYALESGTIQLRADHIELLLPVLRQSAAFILHDRDCLHPDLRRSSYTEGEYICRDCAARYRVERV